MAKGSRKNAKDKYALITGGTSGLGYELAKCFAEDGYNLVLVAKSEEGLSKASSELKNQFGINVRTISRDLIIPGAAKRLYEEVDALGINLEYLVNDAGHGHWGKFIETDLNREIDLVHLNVISLMSLTKYYLKDMVGRDSGKILNLATSLSVEPSPYFAVHAASKAFVSTFTEALIQEVKDTGVTLTVLMPGTTEADFVYRTQGEGAVENKEAFLYNTEEVARAGYEGLMSGKGKVVPGVKNRTLGKMGNILPETTAASNLNIPLDTGEGQVSNESLKDQKSEEERDRTGRDSGKPDSDMDTDRGNLNENL